MSYLFENFNSFCFFNYFIKYLISITYLVLSNFIQINSPEFYDILIVIN